MMIATRSLNFVSGAAVADAVPFVRQVALSSRMTSQPRTAVTQWASNGPAQSENQVDAKANRRELR